MHHIAFLVLRCRKLLHSVAAHLILVTVLLSLLLGSNTSRYVAAQTATETPDSAGATVPDGATALYLPLVASGFNPNITTRLGYSTGSIPITQYPDIDSLNGGWYVDWTVTPNPARPGGMDYMPMVRVHQKLTCGIGVTADRTICPYVTPHAYEYEPSADVIRAYAQAHPGATWLLGNEIDRLDWPGGRQDEILPSLYPVFYKELYDMIKAVDPAAKFAIGGVIEPTPLRLAYLDTIWNTYRQLYGADIPVDVWNVHNFILVEYCRYEKTAQHAKELICYGAGVPPGANAIQGAYLGEDWKHIHQPTFAQHIRTFRQWMKDHGQQEKPLIITEYGVLYAELACPKPGGPTGCQDPNWVDLKNPQVIHNFMLFTFDHFADTSDCTLGYTADGCRLVQRWAWFSLQDVGWQFNPHGALYDSATKQLTEAGQKFRTYSLTNGAKLR